MRNELLASGEEGMSRSELYKELFVSGRGRQEFNSLLSTLHELDLIQVLEVPTRGRTKRVYRATEYLRNEHLLGEVVRKLGMELTIRANHMM